MTEKEGLAQIFVSHIKNARTKLTKRIAGALNWVPEGITIRIGMNCGSALPSLTAPYKVSVAMFPSGCHVCSLSRFLRRIK
ncbi:hypothetical protein [Stutzerimonas stutzeri]|uniref:hypothetical protein n=1 Tax=Stutzerimonas stutzeri TaxID=316 RepID=UPI0011AF8F7A|nr:hypothetical protein [Stutzerimonas stutzeri]MCQ4263154.1 hypothetical protein [Stutzerimonas stutzeri]